MKTKYLEHFIRKYKNKFTPIRTGVLKNGDSVTEDSTKEHSTTLGSPRIALHIDIVNLAPANAIDKVAEPAPALA